MAQHENISPALVRDSPRFSSGDHCRFLPDYEVAHYDCDDFGDGVVTNVLTGKIVAHMVDGKRVSA